jgi:hypothetical protein
MYVSLQRIVHDSLDAELERSNVTQKHFIDTERYCHRVSTGYLLLRGGLARATRRAYPLR